MDAVKIHDSVGDRFPSWMLCHKRPVKYANTIAVSAPHVACGNETFSANYRTVHCCKDQFDARVTAVEYLHEIDLTLITKLWLLS